VSQVIGSIGVGMLLIAFALERLGRIAPRPYAAANAVGAGAAALASAMIGFIPFVVLESAWCIVALGSLFWAGSSSRPAAPDEG
jgi:hypothetical protein